MTTKGSTGISALLRQEIAPLLGALAVFSLFINLLFLVPAIFMMQVFDRVLPSNSQDTLVVLMTGTGIALSLLFVLDYIRNRLQNEVGIVLDARLSPSVVDTLVTRLARTPHSTGMDSLRDVAALRTLFTTQGLIALFDAPWVAVYVAVIWAFHPALGLGAVLCATLMLILAWLNDLTSKRTIEALQQDTQRVSRYVESSVRNAEVLQALGMTTALLERWQGLQRNVAELQSRASRKAVAFAAMSRCLRQTVQIVMLSLGAYLVLNQFASPGIMIATTVLLGRAVQPVEQLVASWRMLAEARSAYRRLRELTATVELSKNRLQLPRPDGHLVVDSLSFRAPGSDRPLLVNVGFSLKAGEALAVIGPSAAGKSTLARLLTGVWAPSVGTVRLDGADIANWPRLDLGPWLGYVPQDVELFNGTVAENIARLGQVNSEAVVHAAVRANAHDLILSLPAGYDTPVGEQGLRLSPGQRQRVALARALYGDPRLVILDEPNSNLDGEGEIALAQALSALRAESVTTVVVTHRPSLIAHVDKILVLESGKVARFGPAAEVMRAMQDRTQVFVGGKVA